VQRLVFPCLLIAGLTACVPYVDHPVAIAKAKPPLLGEHERISDVQVIDGQVSIEGFKGKVFEFVGSRLKQESERLLRKSGRWSEEDALTLHLEVENIRLRRTAAVLFLWQVAGVDEMGIKVWVTRDGSVIASESVATIYDAGGTYGTNSNQRRLAILTNQVVHKMVKRF